MAKNKRPLVHFESSDAQRTFSLSSSEGHSVAYRASPAVPVHTIVPAAELWEAFWLELDELGVWDWAEEFTTEPREPRWVFRLRYGDRVLNATGAGAPMGFEELLRTFEALIGRPLEPAV